MDRIDFAAGGYQAAVPFAGGLAVADGGLLTIQRPGGVTDLSVSLSLSNPVLLTSDQYLFAYDPGAPGCWWPTPSAWPMRSTWAHR